MTRRRLHVDGIDCLPSVVAPTNHGGAGLDTSVVGDYQ